MTEKRYKFDSEVGFIDLDKCNGDTLSNKEVVDLLNENEKLNKRVEIYKKDGIETTNNLLRAEENNRKALINIEKFQNEIELLKQQRDSFRNDLDKLEIAIQRVQNEFEDNQEVQRALARIVIIKENKK